MNILDALKETGMATSNIMDSITYIGYNKKKQLRWFHKDTKEERTELTEDNFKCEAFKPYHPEPEKCESCVLREENTLASEEDSGYGRCFSFLLKQACTCRETK